MKKILLLSIVISFVFTANSQNNTYKLPKILLLTTGDGDGYGTVSDGVVLALQSFNKVGAFVRLENREVLLNRKKLGEFTILILPTTKSYHDKPMRHSLTFMSDMEMENISYWVKNGGTLVAGNNVGRNTLKGKDRLKNILTKENWILSECFGTDLKEMNTAVFSAKDTKLKIWKKDFLNPKTENRWYPVPINTTAKTLSKWYNDFEEFPAMIINKYGKGNAILLPTFDLLHPKADGGLSDFSQIDKFYNYVYNLTIGKRNVPIFINPWKGGHNTAFCWSFDDGGNSEQYQRVVKFIQQYKVKTTFFITQEVTQDLIKLLETEPLIKIQGHSFSHPNFRELNYFETKNEFLRNRQYWNKKFSGFRFPYVSNSFWGMQILEELYFIYETSIAVNHFEHIRGSVIPYNIPIFNDKMYKCLDLLEISQIYNDDWFHYQKVLETDDYSEKMQKEDAKAFEKYLIKFYTEIVEPNKGVMVFLGHPMYSGISEITMQPHHKLMSLFEEKNIWITSLENIANHKNKLKKLNVNVSEEDKKVIINLSIKNDKIQGLSFLLPKKPKKIIYSDFNELIKKDGKIYLNINLENQKELILEF